MISWAVGSRSSTTGTWSLRAPAIRGVQAPITREAVAWETPQTSASSPWGRLCLSQDQGQAHTQEHPQHPGPEGRQGAVGVDRLAQIQDIIASNPRATIHGGGLFLVELASTPKLSQEQTTILLSDTPPL